jgi:hypothetical protein
VSFIIFCLNFLVIAGIATWWWRSLEGFARNAFWPALFLKVLAGIGLGLLYRYYYAGGDTFYFYSEATELVNLFHSNTLEYIQFLFRHPEVDSSEEGSLRTTFLVKVISFFGIFTGSNYWITSLWFSFISFLASFHLFKVVTKHFNKSEIAASLAFLFLPSIIFWSSGIIKESLGLAALFVTAAYYLKIMKGEKWTVYGFLMVLFCLWIVWNLKYYWLAVFLPVVLTSLVCHYGFLYFKISSGYKLISWLALFLLLTFGISLTRPNFYLDRILGVIAENYSAFESISDKSSLIEYYNLSANWQSILLNSPGALFSGLFRPFLWEADNLLKIIISVENLLILVLWFASLNRLKTFLVAPHKLLTLSVIVYTILLCIFLALSTPNFGSLSRYKVGFLPFFVFLISYQNPVIERLAGSLKKLNRNAIR